MFAFIINIYTRIAFKEFFEVFVLFWKISLNRRCIYRADFCVFISFSPFLLPHNHFNLHICWTLHRFIHLDYDASKQTVCYVRHKRTHKGCKGKVNMCVEDGTARIYSKIHKMNWNGNKSVWWYTLTVEECELQNLNAATNTKQKKTTVWHTPSVTARV